MNGTAGDDGGNAATESAVERDCTIEREHDVGGRGDLGVQCGEQNGSAAESDGRD